MISVQPSISTNSISLNGSEISMGDSIIMPIDIKTAATTKINDQKRARTVGNRSETRFSVRWSGNDGSSTTIGTSSCEAKGP